MAVAACFSSVGVNEAMSSQNCCDPMKGIVVNQPIRIREVPGPSGSYGFIVRNKTGHSSMELLDRKAARMDKENKVECRLKKEKFDDLRASFWNKSEVHVLINKIKNLVDTGMKRAEDDLDAKKNKLKVALLKEEVGLTHEFIEKAQQTADRIYEQKRLLAEEIEGKKQREGEAHAQEAYDRIFKESSDEYRQSQASQNKRYCTKINEFQMRDKVLVKMKEKEEEKMWIKLMDKLERAKAEGLTDEFKEYDKTKANKNYGHSKDILIKQLQAKEKTKEVEKEIKREEQAFWKGMNEMFKEDELVLANREANVKAERRKDLLQQIEDNKKRTLKEQEQEANLDKMLQDLNELNYKIQRDRIVDLRMARRRELDIFKENVDQIRRAYQQEEKDLEAMIAVEMKKIQELRNCNRDKVRKARERLNKEVFEARDRQLQENRERAIKEQNEEKARAEYSNFRWKQNDEMDKAKLKIRSENKEDHLSNLIEQDDYERELKRREAEEYVKWLTERKQKAQQYEEKARILLQQPHDHLKHPFIYAFEDNPHCC